jgi:hypothetical protein
MLRNLGIIAFVAIGLCLMETKPAYALRGELKRPGIAVPSSGPEGQPDATVAAMNKVLQAHDKEFVGGHFINAHSVLHFNGGAKLINSLLDELSQIEGAVVRVRFSKEAGRLVSPFIDKVKQPKTCDCVVDHDGSGDARAMTLVIYTGGEDLDLDDLVIPEIKGTAEPIEPARPKK